MEELTVTKERVLEVAKKNPYAVKVLKGLFPEAFEDEKIYCRIGSIFIRKEYPDNVYAVFKWNGEVRVLNVTKNIMWDSKRNLRVETLSDPEGKTLTVSEFRRLVGQYNLSEFCVDADVIRPVSW